MSDFYLKCDAEGCDHVETVSDITESMIGMPCPQCGASLLTREDYDLFQPIRSSLSVLEDLGLICDPADNKEGMTQLRVSSHGGDVNVSFSRKKRYDA